MSKEKEIISKKNNEFMRKAMNADPLEFTSKFKGRKGKPAKGQNKSETAVIRAACVHHYLSEKGKVRSMVSIAGDKIHCSNCDKTWDGRVKDENEVNRIFNEFAGLCNEGKFFSTALDLGPRAVQYFRNISIMTAKFPKTMTTLNEMVEKNGAKKNKGKKKGNHGYSNGTRIPGSWRTVR